MACTTLLRALYICQSLNTSFQSFVKKSNLVVIMALVPQFLLSFHMLNSVRYFLQFGDHPFLLYKACMDPFSFYDVLFTEVLFMDNLLLFIYDLVIVFGNLYLWRFLNGQTEKNRSLREVDKKKERKRNFVTAKNSVITSAATIFSYLFIGISYGLKVLCEEWLNLLIYKIFPDENSWFWHKSSPDQYLLWLVALSDHSCSGCYGKCEYHEKTLQNQTNFIVKLRLSPHSSKLFLSLKTCKINKSKSVNFFLAEPVPQIVKKWHLKKHKNVICYSDWWISNKNLFSLGKRFCYFFESKI